MLTAGLTGVTKQDINGWLLVHGLDATIERIKELRDFGGRISNDYANQCLIYTKRAAQVLDINK